MAAEEKERKEQEAVNTLSKKVGTQVETAQTLMALQVRLTEYLFSVLKHSVQLYASDLTSS